MHVAVRATLLLALLLPSAGAAAAPLAVWIDAAPVALAADAETLMPVAITLTPPCDGADDPWGSIIVTTEAVPSTRGLAVTSPPAWVVPYEGCGIAHAFTREISLQVTATEPPRGAALALYVNASVACRNACPHPWGGTAVRIVPLQVAPRAAPPAPEAPAESAVPEVVSESTAAAPAPGAAPEWFRAALGALAAILVAWALFALRPTARKRALRRYAIDEALGTHAWLAHERATGAGTILLELDHRSARTLATLAHPNLPRVFWSAGRFIAFERPEGAPAAAVSARVANAVAYVRAAEVRCLDPTPALVIVGRDGVAKLSPLALAAA